MTAETKDKPVTVRFATQIADVLITRFKSFAHLKALEALESRNNEHEKNLWRDVMRELDKITEERKQK